MSETQALFSVLKQTADGDVVDAIRNLIEKGEDRELNRVNLLDFARKTGLDEEKVVSGFLHASRLGMFDLGWNVLCPGCGGVLDAHDTLKSLRPDDYNCALCAAGYEASVDELVEVAFTVSPRIRRIAAHDPHTLPIWEYYRQIFWSSGVDVNEESFARLTEEVTLEAIELPPGEKAVLSLQLPKQFVIVFEPVSHAAHFIDVQGEPTRERQQVSMVFNKVHSPTGTTVMRPGPLRLTLDNQSDLRVLPGVWIAGDAMHDMIGRRKPILTAKRILSNQTFRDLYKADNLNIDQRLKITSLTFLFTDLKGSTALYERVGDLAAFDLVRAHFHALLEIIASEKGAVVKTIGDAVMATFIRPEHALQAGLRMRSAMKELNRKRGTDDLIVKIGLHEGPCLAVMLNERQDYFGQTVNVAARVQNLSTNQEIHLTQPVIGAPEVAAIIAREAIRPIRKEAALRGIADKMVVYEIP
ncbi:MAG TPA: adenylate/guanylate cyclase domain-containing protein [Bradyrhizobium sp.]